MWGPPTPEELTTVALSVRVAGIAVLFGLPLAFGLAWILARHTFRGKSLVEAAVALPLVLPPVVTGYFLLLAFSPSGVLGWLGASLLFRWTGAALAAAIMALPLMVGPMRVALENLDPRLEGAARSLGASRGRVLRTIVLPLARPGMIAGAVLGFAKALGEFGATQTFVSSIPGETRTLPLAINAFLQVPGQEAAALRLSGLAVLLSFAALLAAGWFARRSRSHLG